MLDVLVHLALAADPAADTDAAAPAAPAGPVSDAAEQLPTMERAVGGPLMITLSRIGFFQNGAPTKAFPGESTTGARGEP